MNVVIAVLHSALPWVSLVALLSGCGTTKKPDYHPETSAATERIEQQAGVEVAVDPFIESGRTKEFFGVNATGTGLAILHVRLLNHSSDQTFLVEKKDFQLLPPGNATGQEGGGKNGGATTGGGDAVAWFGASVGSIGFVMIGAAMVSQATEIQRNFVAKEMPDQTLPPGQSMEGFIYYKLPKSVDWTRGSSVKIRLPEIKNQQVTELNIPLSR